MSTLNNIVFNNVRQIKTSVKFRLNASYYYQVVYDNGILNLRTTDGLYPLSVPNIDDKNYLISELKNNSNVLIYGTEIIKSVYEYVVFKTANWSLKGITVTDEFSSDKGHSIEELCKKYVLKTFTAKYLIVARPAFGERTMLEENPSNFMLLGENYKNIFRLNCSIKRTGDDEDYVEVKNEEKFLTLANSKDELFIEIVEVPKNFNFNHENEIKSFVVKSRIQGKSSVYLDVWEQYCRVRQEQLIKTIADCGILKIEKVDKDGAATYIDTVDMGGYTLSNFRKKIKETGIKDCYVICKTNSADENAFDKAIVYFRNLLSNYKNNRNLETAGKILNCLAGVTEGGKVLHLKKATLKIEESVSKGKLIIENAKDAENLSDARFICLSGFRIQHQLDNYMAQFCKIMNAQNPMPELANILLSIDENNEINHNYRPLPRHTVDLNSAISYFPVSPKVKQVKALKTALETPDIAIIWGPPGTGKTTLITAILHAIENKEKPQNGTLLTTFQHDALDNLMEKTEVNGLPCLRYGGKDIDNSTVFNDSLIENLNKKAKLLNEKYPEYKSADILYKIEKCLTVLQSGSIQLSYNNVLGFIENILKFCSGELLPGELSELKNFSKKIRQKQTLKTDRNVLNAINKLRVSEVSYNDDGKERLEYLKQLVRIGGIDLLVKPLSYYESAVQKTSFTVAKDMRETLLVNLCGNNRCILNKDETDELEHILKCIKENIIQTLADRYELEDYILSKYVSEFKNNFAGSVGVIKKYNKYSGVTENQLDNKKVQGLLKNRDEFENVIIDEAARSSPMDLFIVMSRASKRIILVGDHCQLPQFIERDKFEKAIQIVRKNNEKNNGDSDEDLTDVSLFEKLLCVAEKLTANDGINRTVMLDEQFRMPSELGNYVSDTFYAGKIKSNPADDYLHAHNIGKYKDKCMVFKNLPIKSEEFNGTSRYRKAEIDWIVNDVTEILADENSKGLSIGIMSFYKAQCEKIAQKLASGAVGILRYADEKATEYSICDKYRERGNSVYVGTVDSFQGMQFDVVYLSVTVSNDRGDVGHLKSVNRLCVGMSRALRLMIVAGDEKMLPFVKEQGGDTEYLAEFRRRCENSPKGVVI